MSSGAPEQWGRVKALFAAARDLPPAARAAWLLEACSGDAVLRAEVESLLREADGDDDIGPVPVIPGYDLRVQLNRGGMAVVWLAWDQGLQREVALKLLRRDALTTPEQITRFQNEPRAVARLDHPAIVKVHATGDTGTIAWFAMDLVRGHDLRTEIQCQREESAGRQPCLLPPRGRPEYVAAVVRIVRDIAAALHYAHQGGVVHRDVKPHNILLRAVDGKALLVDFGIARDQRFGSVTATGVAPGTLHYMSPEQVAVVRAAVDRRTDIYSLGVVLYELLTLRRPFDGQTNEQVLAAIVAAQPMPLRRIDASVPRDLELVCSKAMAKDRRERYATARDFADDLDAVLSLRSPVHARPPEWWQHVRNLLVRRARLLAVAGALMIAVLVGAWWSGHEARAAALSTRVEALQRAAGIDLRKADVRQRARVAALCEARDDDADAEPWLTTVRERLREWRESTFAQVEQILVDVDARDVDDPTIPQDLITAQTAVLALLQVAGDDERSRALLGRLEELAVGSLACTVTIAGDPAAGSLAVARIDMRSGAIGEPVRIGALPLPPTRLLPGYYRFLLELGDGRRLELARNVERGRRLQLAVAQPREVAGSDGMVRIEAGELRIAPNDRYPCVHEGEVVPVASFLLDEAEVSVADYGRFLAASGRQPPRQWEFMNGSPALQNRPVVWITYDDALAYAEWHGKRLPTHAEWEWAARGPTNRRFPWTDDATSEYRGATRTRVVTGGSVAERMEAWARGTHDVRSDPEARTPSGLYHMLGNVLEWTESAFVELQPDRSWPIAGQRVVLGGAWDAEHVEATLEGHARASVLPEAALHLRGFRCARSLPE